MIENKSIPLYQLSEQPWYFLTTMDSDQQTQALIHLPAETLQSYKDSLNQYIDLEGNSDQTKPLWLLAQKVKYILGRTSQPNQDANRELSPTDSVPGMIDSNTLFDMINNQELPQTNAGLIDGVALFGSTHARANWREDVVMPTLSQAGEYFYTPRMADWDPIHAQAEALAMAEMSVLGMRIENKDIENGSLGSMVEIGYMIYSAIMRGQRVVISFEEGLEKTMVDAYTRAQYSLLKSNLEEVTRNPSYSKFVTFKQGNSLEDFSQDLQEALSDQRRPEAALPVMTPEDLEQFEKKRRERAKDPTKLVVLTGTSGAFSEKSRSSFVDDQTIIEEASRKNTPEDQLIILNKPPHSHIWDYAYNAPSDMQYDAFRMAIRNEATFLDQAKTINYLLQEEGLGGGAMVNLPFLLLKAKEQGIQVNILDENFKVDTLISDRVSENLPQFQSWLDQHAANVNPEDLAAAQSFLDDAKAGRKSELTFNRFKKIALFKDHPLMALADNTRRVRSIGSANLHKAIEMNQELKGTQGIELFSHSNGVDLFVHKQGVSDTPKGREDRDKYLENYRIFKQALKNIIAQNKADLAAQGLSEEEQRQELKKVALILIDQAISVINPVEKRFKGLTDHLKETEDFSAKFIVFLHEQALKNNRDPYLTFESSTMLASAVPYLHDRLKFLSFEGQEMPDHETLMGFVAKEFLPQLGYSEEETTFISQVCADHENIFKELGRDTFAASSSQIDRAKAAFFVIDTLTNVIEIDGETLSVNTEQLNKRFTDLYYRHIDLIKGKNFRPQWGALAVKDFVTFFNQLESTQGIQLEPNFYQKIIKGALDGIYQAIKDNQTREMSGQTDRVFSRKQKKQVLVATQNLEQLYLSYGGDPQEIPESKIVETLTTKVSVN